MTKLIRRIQVPVVWLFLLGSLALACRLTSEPPATVAPAPTAEVAAATEPAADVVTEMPPATNTPLPSPTAVLAATEQPPTSLPQATATVAATETATEAVTEAPTEAATAVSTPVVGETFTPGQQDTATLAAGAFKVYPYQGTAFQPVLIFVEAADAVDVAVTAYEGSITAGAELSALSAMAEADAGTAGGPEILVFTPNEDGLYSLVVSNSAEEDGQYTVYLFDATAQAATVALSQTATLAAGESQSYTAQSHGGRPVLVFADQTGQSDLMVEMLNENGQMVAEANFGGGGSAEAVYALPLQTTTYTIRVSEVAGGAAGYSILVVTLN